MNSQRKQTRDGSHADRRLATYDTLEDDLRKQIQEKKVVVLVGAGLSRNVCDEAPSWLDLVKCGIEYANSNDRGGAWCDTQLAALGRQPLDLDELFGAANMVAKKLAGVEFDRWLKQTFTPLKAQRPEAIDALLALGLPVMTTNYDDLLTGHYSRKVVTPTDGNSMSEWLRGDAMAAKSVFHIHGHYEKPATIVFSESQYDRVVYQTDAQSALLAVGQTKSLLIVGCSTDGLRDPNLGRFLDRLAEYEERNAVQSRHYRLVIDKDKDQPRGRVHCLVYGDKHEDLADFLRRLHPEPIDSKSEVGRGEMINVTLPSRSTAKPTPAIRFYLNKLAENHKFLAMRGMNTDFGVELPIDKVYVPLTTTPGRMDERLESDRSLGLKSTDDKFKRSERDIELSDIFRESESQHYRGIILLGEPGAGKTTGARQLTWRLASGESLPEDLGLPAGIRPVFLRLRNLDSAMIDTQGSDSDQLFAINSLRRFLDQETHCPGGSSEEQNPGPDLWNASVQGHGLLWILDGLDEVVDPKLRAIVAGWIRDILPERPADRFFVTSRFHGYQSRDVALGERFLEMHVKPLSKDQITQFVTQWFQAAHRRIDGNTPQADENAASDQAMLLDVLRSAPYQSPSMLAMVANPMLLTIVCIVFKRDHNLPTARAELYKQCVVVLLESWRAEKFKKTRQRIDKPFEVHAARSVLSKLAWWMHQAKDRSEVAIAELAQEATTALQRVSPESNLGINGWEFIDRMRQDSGILAMSGEGKGKIGFLHLSFQEYLTAEYAARQGLAREIARHVSDSWWREAALLSLRCDTSEEYVKAFFSQLVSDGVLESNPDLSDRCIRETIHFPPEPFLEVLERPTASPSQVASVLRVLRSRQKQVPQLADWCQKLMNSTHKEVKSLACEILAGLGVDVPRSSVTSAVPQALVSPTSVEPAAIRVDDRTGQTLLWIPAGGFQMGSKRGDADEQPVRDVRFTQGFYLGMYPVTNEQYGRYLNEQTGQVRVPEYWDNRRFNQPEQPVVGVSWDEALAYCQWAGGRLPTAAEWEHACRAGSTTDYCFGDDVSQLGEYAWFRENSGGQTQPVGRKKANEWGFHDMHGNVWEWCQDWFGEYDARQLVDPTGPLKGSHRVVRGGCWSLVAADCRTALRNWLDPALRGYGLGFRLALSFVGVPDESGQDKKE